MRTTYGQNKITTSKQTTMYDHLCKMIIGNEEES